MLKVESINYTYQKSFQLRDISFELDSGQILGIIGESGCGKTTILNLIFGKLDTAEGSIYWSNNKILGPSHQLIAGREDFKYVTQDFELMPYTSVLENIIKPLSRQYLEDNIIRANELLKVVNLEEHQNKKVKNLSGGQKQRVALAQALANTPKLLLLDEPFSHIDSFFKNKLRRELFRFLKKEKITCIIATHDKADVLAFSDKILVLKQGEMLDYRSPKQLYNSPSSGYVAGLFGDYNLVNSKFISTEFNEDEIVVYPNEIELRILSKNSVKITDQYFMGEYYKVIVNYKSKTFIVHSLKQLNEHSSYILIFKVDTILNRLGK